MAIVRMRSATIIGTVPVMDGVVDALQRSGAVEIVSSPHDLPVPAAPDSQYSAAHVDADLSRARRLASILERYHANDQPFSMFVSEKFHTTVDEYRELRFHDRTEDVYRQAVELESEIQRVDDERAAQTELIQSLQPWLGYPVPVERWADRAEARSFHGTVSSEVADALVEALAATSPLVDAEQVPGARTSGAASGAKRSAVPERVAVAVFAHSTVEDDVAAVLTEYGFEQTQVSGLTGTAAANADAAAERVLADERVRAQAEDRLRRLSEKHYGDVYLLVAALESQADRIEVREQFGATEVTFVVTGWLPESREADLRRALHQFEGDIDVTLEDPAEGDLVPVELQNPRILKPFELLTDLYGRPKYGEVDPTPLIAPFFTFFVGLCIADVGYGLMLVLAMYLVGHKLDVAPGVRRFTALMSYGGWMAVPVGIAFGSYLAIPFERLPGLLQAARIIDPLNDVIVLIGFTLVVGAVQVVLGIVVAAWAAFRRGDPEGAIGSHLSTLFLLACVAVYAVTGAAYPAVLAVGIMGTVLLQGRAITVALRPNDRPLWDRALGVLWAAGFLALAVAFAIEGAVVPALWTLLALTAVGASLSHTARRVVIATLGGAYAVYGLTGILNDTLSYTRLAALGLSSALVGMVFNIIAEMVWVPASSMIAAGGFSLVTGGLVAVLAALLFTVGHIFNVTISLLGAFVHPMRLQFVEFFGKFYEAGNQPFSPMQYRQDRIVLDAGEPSERGGVS